MKYIFSRFTSLHHFPLFSHSFFSRLNSFLALIILFTLLLIAPVSPLSASDEPFTYPSNWGGTGLMEIPTARVIKENSFRIGASQIKPYRFYYGAISPLKGLEIDGRIIEIIDVPALTPDYGNYKDKAIDLKYQIVPEGKYIPAIAIGIMDPQGTRIYPSQYIVVGKQIYPFDFTLGYGNGRFGKKPLPAAGERIKLEILSSPKSWLNDSQFFWGIQFSPSEKYALMIEYSPIEYHKQTSDPAQKKYFEEPVRSKYNFGFRYRPTKWSEIDLSYQRGDQIGVNFSVAFDIGKPFLPIYDLIYKGRRTEKTDLLYEQLASALYNSGFSDIGVIVEGSDLKIEAQNEKYFYNTRAIGVILEILVSIIPENVEKIHIILKENGIPMIEFTTTAIDLFDLYAEKMSLNEFLYLSRINTDRTKSLVTKGKYRKQFRYGLRPDLQMFLNDPSGFFKYRLGVSGLLSYHPWKGASLIAGLATYAINNISTVNEPLSIPVKSDLVLYKEENVTLDRLMFDQVKKLTPKLYGKVSAGLLEVQYAGIDAEVATPVLDGRILLGLSGSAVRKRHINKPFELESNDVKDIYTTAFFNTRLNIPEKEIAIDMKAGRFLAGDYGVRFTVSKHINGVTIWAWYSLTDTSIFDDDFNKGYHDKGIGVSIPIRLFKGTDSRTAYKYSISPWTRDTGQDIDHFSTLFDFIGRNAEIILDKDSRMMYR